MSLGSDLADFSNRVLAHIQDEADPVRRARLLVLRNDLSRALEAIFALEHMLGLEAAPEAPPESA